MARFVTPVRVTGSMTKTAFVREQDTQARRGVPANTMSPGPAGVSKVATTFCAATSTMLMDEEMWFTTHSSLEEAKRAETGSNPTAMLPMGAGTPDDTSNNSTRLSGRLQIASVRPSGPSATGCTGAVSKFTKFVMAVRARIVIAIRAGAQRWRAISAGSAQRNVNRRISLSMHKTRTDEQAREAVRVTHFCAR